MRRVVALFIGLAFSASVLILEPVPAQAADTVLNIVAMGDSYTAGNGATEYYGPEGCYRSWNNYSEQYAEKVRSEGYKVSVKNIACSSSVTDDIPKQLAELSGSEKQSADLVLVSIGGNDAYFSSIVFNCFQGWLGQHDILMSKTDCERDINRAFDLVSTIKSRTRQRLLEIAGAMPNARVVLVGYPYLVSECHSDPIYRFDTYPSGEQVRSLGLLADSMQRSLVRELGPRFLQVSLLETYRGHEVCGTVDPQYIRLHAETALKWEWWHPNKEGHAATARLLMSLNFHEGFVTSDPPPAPTYQLPPPSSGQPTYGLLPFSCGTIVPYASTYDSFWYDGRTIYHSLSLDMPMKSGSEVVAPEAGAAYVRSNPGGYGRYIDLVGDSGLTHRMAHLQDSVLVGDGQRVSKGKVIAKVGTTGATTGPHLHYEQRNGSGQVAINLAGPTLQWGAKQDSSGFRTTTHALVSGNCSGSSSADRFADILTWEYGQMRYGRSDGYDYSNWEIGVPGITDPHWSAACDFDGDGWDEYISYELHLAQFALADPHGNGKFDWRIISTNNPRAREFACGDWNHDGKDDIIMHNTDNLIYFGKSDGNRIVSWQVVLRGIGAPTYLELCDINGDGQVEAISYEGWGNQLMVGKRRGDNTMEWAFLLKGIYAVGGMTCGNFTSHSGDELLVWQPEQNGRFVIGEFDGAYRRIHWDPLTPTGLAKPYGGELNSGDIDGDGKDEFVSNEYRFERGDNSVMIGDFDSNRHFTWHAFIEGVSPRNLEVGRFIG